MAKIKTGTVVSTINNKTVTVTVDRMISHPKYGKRFRVSQKFLAHDESNQAALGDVVTIEETRPISKRKNWKVTDIVKKGEIASELKSEVEGGVQ